MPHVLLVGESWTTITTHQKGFDSFSTVDYTESAIDFKRGLRDAGWEVTHLPAHRVGEDFPRTAGELTHFDAVVLSDVGSNTFLLPTSVFVHSVPRPDPLAELATYVRDGGALLMVGGYMSFTGIEGKARFGMTVLADVLPVELLAVDDRIELPSGGRTEVLENSPLAALGTPPALLGYNRTRAKAGADVWATIEGDPLVAVADFGAGRCGVFTSDLAPHWASPQFVSWHGYAALWTTLIADLIRS